MRVLVTAGSTQVPIDKVRTIGNIFKGRTGEMIARHLSFSGSDVTLLASNPPVLDSVVSKIRVTAFSTFEDLLKLMEKEIRYGQYDAVIHSAAVSDYDVSQILDESLVPLDRSAKISSSHKVVYLKMSRTPKIIDLIRDPWGFGGILAKFKLVILTGRGAPLSFIKKADLVTETKEIKHPFKKGGLAKIVVEF